MYVLYICTYVRIREPSISHHNLMPGLILRMDREYIRTCDFTKSCNLVAKNVVTNYKQLVAQR